MKTMLSDFAVELPNSPGGDLLFDTLTGYGIDARAYARPRMGVESPVLRQPRAAQRPSLSNGSTAATGPVQVTIQCINFDWQRVAFIGIALAVGVGLGWLVATAAGAKAAAVAAAAL